MVSREEVLKAIIEITGGNPEEEFTRNAVKERLGRKSERQIDRIIEELTKEGVVVVSRTRGRVIYYRLAKEVGKPEGTPQKQEPAEPTPADGTFKALRDLLDEYFRKYFELYFGKPKTEKDLDRVYEQVKDGSGLTTIEILRKQMGMTLEQFMAKFRDYIIEHYELHPGGKEGIVLNGVMHGVIRRKV